MVTTPAVSGVRHARATRSMFALAPGRFQVYMALRYLIADGAAAEITQAEIATVAQCSESTVNSHVPALDSEDGLITLERVARTDVRGTRWRITMHAPPELVTAGAWYGSAADPPATKPPQRTRTQQSAPAEGSAADQHEDMNHDQQQQHETPTASGLTPDQALLYTALRAAHAHPPLARQIVEKHPTRTPEQFHQDLAAASRRRGVRCPLGLVLSCWLAGAPVVASAGPTKGDDDGRGDPARNRRDGVRRGNRAAHRGAAPGAAVGGDAAPELPGPAPELPAGPVDREARRAAFLRQQALRC